MQTISHGREGIMPALGPALGEQGTGDVSAYVLSLSGRKEPADRVQAGKARFALCAACHGADGKGNYAIGAPNLTDDIWLYGGSETAVRKSVADGRHGQMPAHEWLGDDKIRLLARTSTVCRTMSDDAWSRVTLTSRRAAATAGSFSSTSHW